MQLSVFYSDVAILIYELICIILLLVFIRKLSKEKKACREIERLKEQKNQTDRLDELLRNKQRG